MTVAKISSVRPRASAVPVLQRDRVDEVGVADLTVEFRGEDVRHEVDRVVDAVDVGRCGVAAPVEGHAVPVHLGDVDGLGSPGEEAEHAGHRLPHAADEVRPVGDRGGDELAERLGGVQDGDGGVLVLVVVRGHICGRLTLTRREGQEQR